MKVAVFGGTGYVGSYIVDELIAQGHTPRVMVRIGSEHKVQQPDKCEIIGGQINDQEAISAGRQLAREEGLLSGISLSLIHI